MSENHENAINENHENDIKLKAGGVIPQMGDEDGSSSLEKSGGSQGSGQNGIQIDENIYESPSCTEYPGAGSQGSVGHGKSGSSQGSGQNGNQTNENDEEKPIPESPSLSEKPGAGNGGSVGHGKSGGSQGSGQNGSQTNENLYESLPLPGSPGNEDAISPGHPGGN